MIRRLIVSSIAAGIVALSLSASAQAKITVANQNDSGPGSLREAIATASPGETISVPAGTYTVSEQLKIEQQSLTIVGASEASTTIRGNGSSGVIFIIGPGEVNLQNLTIKEGRMGTGGAGAGVFAAACDLSLDHVAIVQNSIDANGASGSPGGSGAGAGLYFAGSTLEVFDSTLSENSISAEGGSGKSGGNATGTGIFAVATGGPLRIVRTTIAGNTIHARGGQGPSNAGQSGGSVAGGGAFLTSGGGASIRIVGNTISGNSADVSGGPGGENGSITGGGLFSTSGSPVLFTEMTIAGNVARGLGPGGSVAGGGAYISSGFSFSISDTTVSSNRIEGPIVEASVGGNAFLAGKVQIRNSIFADGVGSAASGNCFPTGEVESLGFNIDSTDQCGFHSGGDRVNTEPQLGPLQDNGGPTQTMLPAASSPAVDQGSSFGTADQRGVTRPIDFPSIANAPTGDGSDIGAVELQPASSLSLAKPKLNKKKGTATVTATIPAPSAGTLTLTGKGLKPQSVSLTGQASVALAIAPAKGLAKTLRKKGAAKAKFEVLYTPTGNAAAAKAVSVKLTKKAKKKRAGHR